jgi:hypothetical protein
MVSAARTLSGRILPWKKARRGCILIHKSRRLHTHPGIEVFEGQEFPFFSGRAVTRRVLPGRSAVMCDEGSEQTPVDRLPAAELLPAVGLVSAATIARIFW